MKIVHLSDTHLGARQMHYTDARGRNTREQDIYNVFTAAIDKILELQPTRSSTPETFVATTRRQLRSASHSIRSLDFATRRSP